MVAPKASASRREPGRSSLGCKGSVSPGGKGAAACRARLPLRVPRRAFRGAGEHSCTPHARLIERALLASHVQQRRRPSLRAVAAAAAGSANGRGRSPAHAAPRRTWPPSSATSLPPAAVRSLLVVAFWNAARTVTLLAREAGRVPAARMLVTRSMVAGSVVVGLNTEDRRGREGRPRRAGFEGGLRPPHSRAFPYHWVGCTLRPLALLIRATRFVLLWDARRRHTAAPAGVAPTLCTGVARHQGFRLYQLTRKDTRTLETVSKASEGLCHALNRRARRSAAPSRVHPPCGRRRPDTDVALH
jgi:hypothetical protein